VFDLQGHHMRAGITWDFTTGDTAAITPLHSFDGTDSGADPKGSLSLVNVALSAEATPLPFLFGRTSTGGREWRRHHFRPAGFIARFHPRGFCARGPLRLPAAS